MLNHVEMGGIEFSLPDNQNEEQFMYMFHVDKESTKIITCKEAAQLHYYLGEQLKSYQGRADFDRNTQGHREYQIWAEGWAATGERGTAQLRGVIEADSFKEACDLLAEINPEFKRYYNPEHLTEWGCRLFDNEADARRSYG